MHNLFVTNSISNEKNGKFLWQCFKCGKQYIVSENIDDGIEESWGPPK